MERTQIPLYTITMARGTVPDDHPLCMGYADPALNYAVHTVFREADLFLVAGQADRLPACTGRYATISGGGEVYSDRHSPAGIGHESRARRGDLRGCAGGAGCDSGRRSGAALEWLERVRELRAAVRERGWRRPMRMRRCSSARCARRCLTDVLFSWDGGDFAHWGRALLPARHAGGWLRLGPLGTIGSSLPNAIALQLAHPGRKVVAITGDGALGFYLAEMDTGGAIQAADRTDRGQRCRLGTGARAPIVGHRRRADGGVRAAIGALRPGDEGIRRATGDHRAAGGGASGIERALASRVPYCLNVKIRGARLALHGLADRWEEALQDLGGRWTGAANARRSTVLISLSSSPIRARAR